MLTPHSFRRCFAGAAVAAALAVFPASSPALVDEPKPGLSSQITEDDAEEIRDLLEDAVEEALTQNEFDSFVDLLNEQDEGRVVEELSDAHRTALNNRIAQIRRDWKAKYGREFDIGNEDVIFRDYQITQAVATEDDPQDTLRASIAVPAIGGLPKAMLSVENEKVLTVDRWRFDVRNLINRGQLYNNLATALTRVGQNVQAWPADQTEAYRWVAAHVFAALSGPDLKLPPAGDTGAAAAATNTQRDRDADGKPAAARDEARVAQRDQQNTQRAAPQDAPEGFVLIEERIVYLLANEPQQHFTRAVELMGSNDNEKAAGEIRVAAAYLNMQGGRQQAKGQQDKAGQSGGDRQTLSSAADRLQQLAGKIEKGEQKVSPEQIRTAFATANKALARHHLSQAERAISKDKKVMAGHDLQAATMAFEQASVWSGQTPNKESMKAIVSAQQAAAQLLGVDAPGQQQPSGEAQPAAAREPAKTGESVDPSQAVKDLRNALDRFDQQQQSGHSGKTGQESSESDQNQNRSQQNQ